MLLVLRLTPHARCAGILVPQKPPDFSCVSRRIRQWTPLPLEQLPTHKPPLLWIPALRPTPRASGVDLLVQWKPPGVDYISRRVRHDRPPPGTSENVDILRVDCFIWVRTERLATLAGAYATIATFRNSGGDVNIESMRLPRLGIDGVVQSRTACVGVREGNRKPVAVGAVIGRVAPF